VSRFADPGVAVVCHRGFGHSARQAQAVAGVEGVRSVLIRVNDQWESLEEMDAIIFGAPTCMCSASAQFKITGQRAQEYGHAGRVPRREQRQTLSQSCKASP
jgi:multimeric flavodoxin WrbA